MNLEPIVQIVHYSDIHLRGEEHARQKFLWERAKGWLPAEHQQGLAVADRQALSAFEDFLRNVVARDPAWRGRPIWLVDTGDGTTFGDDQSLTEWVMEWTSRFKRAAGQQAEHLMLYGNHDAWPGNFPACAPHRLEAQRVKLRRRWFKPEMPRSPLSVLVPGTVDSRVELYVANTVDHRLLPAIFSWGWAAPDGDWATGHHGAGDSVADRLEHWSSTFRDSGYGSHFRILATHYPVCSEAQPGRNTAMLRNREALAGDLADPKRRSLPLVHLLLSGHTHNAYPPQGQWPADLRPVLHQPLAVGSCQVVSASLSQVVEPGAAAAAAKSADLNDVYPHQCTLLRVYRRHGAQPSLVVERIVVGRAGSGSFAFLPVQESSPVFAEKMAVGLAA